MDRRGELRANPTALRTIRTLLGFTQPSLALGAGVGESTVGNIEAGSRQPSRTTAEAISVALGVPVEAWTTTAPIGSSPCVHCRGKGWRVVEVAA